MKFIPNKIYKCTSKLYTTFFENHNYTAVSENTIIDEFGRETTLSEETVEEHFSETDKIDNVNHPSHYTSHPSGIECITIARHYCFSIGNAFKYLWRAGLKNDNPNIESKQKEIEDLKKAIWYINDRIKQLEQ